MRLPNYQPQHVLLMLEGYGDPNNDLIQINEGRTFKDKDGFAERTIKFPAGDTTLDIMPDKEMFDRQGIRLLLLLTVYYMHMNQENAQSRRKRFRISLLLLTALFFTKIWTLGGHTNARPDTIADEGMEKGFTPVTEENTRVWGLAGDVLSLFSGGHRSPSEIDREVEEDRAQRQATDQANQKRYWKEYDERREEEHEARDQEMYETQERRRAEEDAYHEQQQRQYEEDRRRQEQNY